MARIVRIESSSPLILRQEDLVNGSVAVCRCGLSAAWPYCNGTHKQAKGEEPGCAYLYERVLPEGTVRRKRVDGVGDLEPLLEGGEPASTPPQGRAASTHAGSQHVGSQHAGGGDHRGKRPAPEQARSSSKGNLAGSEPEGAGEREAEELDRQDELLEGDGRGAVGRDVPEPKQAHGGREGLAPKNGTGQGGESA